jgi:hypothetical protein
MRLTAAGVSSHAGQSSDRGVPGDSAVSKRVISQTFFQRLISVAFSVEVDFFETLSFDVFEAPSDVGRPYGGDVALIRVQRRRRW